MCVCVCALGTKMSHLHQFGDSRKSESFCKQQQREKGKKKGVLRFKPTELGEKNMHEPLRRDSSMPFVFSFSFKDKYVEEGVETDKLFIKSWRKKDNIG